MGVVDQEGYNKIDASARKVKAAINGGDFLLATNELENTQGVVANYTFGVDFYNIFTKIDSTTFEAKGKSTETQLNKLMNGPVKEALNLNTTWVNMNWEVSNALAEDFMKPATNTVEQLLNNTDINICILSRQLDLIVDTPGTIRWIDSLRWSKSSEWQHAPRKPLSVNGCIEGYIKSLGQLALYWVNRSGHMIPKDNPAAMEAILSNLIK